ncbi:retrovirus-related pol polyprotein from transposon TNT 1-94 [Tanacetum coccineum]
MTKKFEISMMGELTYFLGLQIKQDDKGISICQEQYTRNLLKKYEISDSSSDKTPMVPPNNLGSDLADPPADETQSRLFKVYLIKFSMMNCKKPLNLDFKTFTKSTGLDYNNGEYVAHPSPEVVKAELAKIVTNPSYLDKTPVFKNSFRVAWRILFTFVIQVLNGNYSSTKQINSIQQMIAFCLMAMTKVKIGEIIYNDLVTKLTNKSRQKYISYLRFVSYALEVFLDTQCTQDKKFRSLLGIMMSTLPFSRKKKKVKSHTVTPTLPKSHGPKASGVLSKKRQKPKSKKTPTETKVTPSTRPMEGSEKSHLVSLSNVPNPRDPERNIQLAGGNVQPTDKGLPSMISDKGTAKTTLLPKGPHVDKDSEGLKPPADMEPLTNHVVDPSRIDAKYKADQTQSDRLRYRSLTKKEGKTSSEVEPDSETLQIKIFVDVQALLLSNDEIVHESDDEEVFAVGEEMDDVIPPTCKEVQYPPPNTDKPESSHSHATDESNSNSSCPELNKFDNIPPLTERQLVKYLRKVSRVLFNRISEDQWEKHEEATVSYVDLRASIEGNSTERADLLKALNGVTKILKAVQEVVKEDPALNKNVLKATEAYTANSNNITELLSLAKTFDFFDLKSLFETVKADLDAHNDHLETWAKSSTSMAWNVGPKLTKLSILRFLCR